MLALKNDIFEDFFDYKGVRLSLPSCCARKTNETAVPAKLSPSVIEAPPKLSLVKSLLNAHNFNGEEQRIGRKLNVLVHLNEKRVAPEMCDDLINLVKTKMINLDWLPSGEQALLPKDPPSIVEIVQKALTVEKKRARRSWRLPPSREVAVAEIDWLIDELRTSLKDSQNVSCIDLVNFAVLYVAKVKFRKHFGKLTLSSSSSNHSITDLSTTKGTKGSFYE